MKRRVLMLALAASVAGYALVAACTSTAPLNNYCTGIPAHGCPGEDSTNCEDRTCQAIYTYSASCVWSLVTTCPNYQPDAGHDAGPGADAALDGALDAKTRDASIRLPPGAAGGPGCEDLEMPDCPLATGVACDDCCGCQDLYVCSDGGWNVWGECDDAGVPVEAP